MPHQLRLVGAFLRPKEEFFGAPKKLGQPTGLMCFFEYQVGQIPQLALNIIAVFIGQVIQIYFISVTVKPVIMVLSVASTALGSFSLN